jgi:hypothetical protein
MPEALAADTFRQSAKHPFVDPVLRFAGCRAD